ncbi:MAG: oxidoreductase [Bacteroidetes bacterium GWF2_42_66]|nr:MAG: oxidoreductase [Bacteroidetes bacterium GWA2_42_15]OFY02595.1 MAG: oxidoreductase [Bacteroidetes bacterium GWE2_42_39]OFY41305.1 MAG: oxidoreductase [Bacteroidetes bacterium GWF2_42_66]HBL75500.1 oxidoreductase [Prolixibacteraceae bacterium]HCU60591.1 oxidoreductase [Prolixibacteraceae bacterium]
MSSRESSRRTFLRQSLALGALTAFPAILTKAVSGAEMPLSQLAGAGERVNLACCGIGNRGGEIIQALYNTGLANIVALCDVDMGAPHTLKVLEKFPDVPRFQDFRVMFDKMGSQIEAVTVGTPDFSHFPITMLAMSLGKHVYVEKPMARTFNEVELMMKGAEKYKVVTQMGNQGHSEGNYFQFKTWVEKGIIKDVTAITAHMNGNRRWHGWDPKITKFPDGQPIPETMDWDTWLMTAHHHDYHKDYVNGQWRCWYDFGMGALGDWGAHIMDTAHQFLDLGLPYEVDPVKLDGHNPFFFPMASTLSFKFPKRGKMPPLEITWYDGVKNVPAVPEGYGASELDPNIPPASNGKIQPAKLNPGKIIYSKDLIFKGGSHGSTLSIIPEEKAKDMEPKLPEVPKSPSNHYANFLLACKGQEETRSPFSVAGPLSQVFNLGVLAQQLNTKLLFDRKTKQITNNKVANQLLVGTPPRKGWEQYYKL